MLGRNYPISGALGRVQTGGTILSYIGCTRINRPLDLVEDPDVICLLASGAAHRGGSVTNETPTVLPTRHQRELSSEYSTAFGLTFPLTYLVLIAHAPDLRYGAFPLHGTVRFGTVRYGSVQVGLRFHRSLVPL